MYEGPGRYRHYKGKEYEVLMIAKHEAHHQSLVIYKADDGTAWARSLHVFDENVLVGIGDLKQVPRFEKIDN